MKRELTVFSMNGCVYCTLMKDALNEWGIPFVEANIDDDYEARAFLMLDEGHRSVPQLYYGSFHINKNINTTELTEEHVRSCIKRLEG